VDFCDGADVDKAVALAKDADAVLVFVGTLSQEGSDRDSLSMDSDDLVATLAKAAGSKLAVIASVPGAVLMPWSRDVAAVLTNFMPGQQAGNAIADVLFGRVNPSGKLPLTFPNKENEVGFTEAQWPGLPADDPAYAYYSEKLLVGYRHYDAHNLTFTTGFPFGHGLSYTAFSYSGLAIEGSGTEGAGPTVSFDVNNTGQSAGAEVAQLYLAFPPSAGEPPLQLKGFRKTRVLSPGESQRIALTLRARDLSIWDNGTHGWAKVEGLFGVHVGSSSRDLRLSQGFASGHAAQVYVV